MCYALAASSVLVAYKTMDLNNKYVPPCMLTNCYIFDVASTHDF